MANSTTSTKGREENRANPAMEKAKDLASQAVDKVKEGASSVGDMVSHAASNVGKTAENLTASAGSSLRNLGDSLSQNAPQEGMLGQASQAVASTLRDSGRYIEDAGLSGMAEDMTDLIRRNPVPAILVGMGIGFLIGRAMRS